MASLRVGDKAPAFRLPTGQGSEVGLDDYRGRPVVVWFTKGMACPFCRQHMSHLARGYPSMRELGAEVLEVTFSKPDRARFYVQNFTIPWPYLCDPDYAVRREWGLEERSHSPLYYVKNAFLGMTMEQPPNDYGASSPTMGEMTKLVRDDDMGLFVVDRDGIVRYAFSGSYMTEGGARKMPSNEEVLRELERFAAKGS